MLIRKLYTIECAHTVRNCYSERCRLSLHGHSYNVELFFTADGLDNGGMIYDFGLLGGTVREIVDSFDHATLFWDEDTAKFIEFCKENSARWVSVPVNLSVEQMTRVFFLLVDKILQNTEFNNGEKNVRVHSVLIHETKSSYAQCYKEDAYSEVFGFIDLSRVVFSDDIKKEWKNREFLDKLFN